MIQSHHLPTCDDVFEVLTRGPFPTGEHETDFPVERHLTVCHSCRQLAEALRPATEMLSGHQADDGDDSSAEKSSWPVYLAEGTNDAGRFPADQTEQKDTAVLPLGAKGSLAVLALTVAMLASLGVHAMGGAEVGSSGAAPPVRLPGAQWADEPGGPSAVVTGPALAPICSLAAVDTVRASSAGNGALLASMVAENFSAAECCSQCHHPEAKAQADHAAKATSAALQRPQMLALVSRCAICHVPQ